MLVFLPALTLASFWLGGEEMLTIVALGLPLVFVMTGAIGLRDNSAALQSDVHDGIAAAAAVDGATGRDAAPWPLRAR